MEAVRGRGFSAVTDDREGGEDAPNDVLADDLQVGRPQLALLERLAASPRIARRREVVDEGVDPDVDRVLRVIGYRDTPREARGRARDRQVVQVGRGRVGERGDQGGRARRWLNGYGKGSARVAEGARWMRGRTIRRRVEPLEQRLLERRQPELVVLLLHPLDPGARLDRSLRSRGESVTVTCSREEERRRTMYFSPDLGSMTSPTCASGTYASSETAYQPA